MLCQGCWIVGGARKGLYRVKVLSTYLNSFEVNSSTAVVATFRREFVLAFSRTLVDFNRFADK